MVAEDSECDPDDPTLTIPRERYNAMLAVLRNTLYMSVFHFRTSVLVQGINDLSRYGGILEIGPKEFTLDDFYSLSLDKLDRYVCVKPCEIDLPKEGEILESSSDEDEDGDDDESDDSDDECAEDDEGGNTPEGMDIGESVQEGPAQALDEDSQEVSDIECSPTQLPKH